MNITWEESSSILWGGASVSNSGSGTSISSGGYTYYRGSLKSKLENFLFTVYRYGIYRTSGGSKTVNTGIPSSGAISLSQMRGGTKT
jgi:protein gp37